ncbi:MAG: YeeE/YedE family protein [Deltaproteobacteria bacterium]|nr:YeeE/YedE family protein [Deltaproteobacteria bacterium]
MKPVVALLTGVLFGVGLLISGMATPAKVIGFLDVGGAWDPSLAFVMAAAIGVHAPLVWLARRRSAPLFDATFDWPAVRRIDLRLLSGAAIFGVGWGISGYCPGPALVSVGAATTPVLVFVGAMFATVVATHAILARR